MPDRLDLPALGSFLRNLPPSVIVHDRIAQGQGHAAIYSLDANRWLELLAAVLGCSPMWLLETGRITAEDLAERGGIGATARLIRSHGWEKPPPPSPIRSPAPAARVHAGNLSDTWRAARDAYIGHLMICPDCIAHRLRYPIHCGIGRTLRRTYDDASATESSTGSY